MKLFCDESRSRAGEIALDPKGDPRKVLIAAKLRQETTMNYQWIAEKLAMASASNVSNLLVAHRKTIS